MLVHVGLPEQYWQYAMSTAAHTTNRIVSSTSHGKSLIELWSGTITDLSYLRTFGFRAYGHVSNEKRSKFDPNTYPGTIIGYPLTMKAYVIED